MMKTNSFPTKKPEYFFLETGNICNLKCPGCLHGTTGHPKKTKFLTRSEFDYIFDQVSDSAKLFILFHSGEPFLNKDLLYMAERCKIKNICTYIDSNLCAFDFEKEFCEMIVKSGLTCIQAALDGTSQQTYQTYRIGGDFQRVIRNIENIERVKKELKSETPYIIWKFIVTKYNEHEIDDAYYYAERLGVSITFAHIVNVPERFIPSKYSTISGLLPKPRLKENFLFSNFNKICNNFYSDHSKDRINLHSKLPILCRMPFDTMVIDSDGDVYPCACVYPSSEYTIGNIFKSNIENIWRSEKINKCREFLLTYGNTLVNSSICATMPCPLTEKTPFINNPINFNSIIDDIGSRTIAIWGTGGRYKEIYKEKIKRNKENIKFFIDNNIAMEGCYIDGKPCYLPTHICIEQPDIIVIASCYLHEICNQLESMHFKGIIAV